MDDLFKQLREFNGGKLIQLLNKHKEEKEKKLSEFIQFALDTGIKIGDVDGVAQTDVVYLVSNSSQDPEVIAKLNNSLNIKLVQLPVYINERYVNYNDMKIRSNDLIKQNTSSKEYSLIIDGLSHLLPESVNKEYVCESVTLFSSVWENDKITVRTTTMSGEYIGIVVVYAIAK